MYTNRRAPQFTYTFINNKAFVLATPFLVHAPLQNRMILCEIMFSGPAGWLGRGTAVKPRKEPLRQCHHSMHGLCAITLRGALNFVRGHHSMRICVAYFTVLRLPQRYYRPCGRRVDLQGIRMRGRGRHRVSELPEAGSAATQVTVGRRACIGVQVRDYYV